jgi:hypothetical protein
LGKAIGATEYRTPGFNKNRKRHHPARGVEALTWLQLVHALDSCRSKADRLESKL